MLVVVVLEVPGFDDSDFDASGASAGLTSSVCNLINEKKIILLYVSRSLPYKICGSLGLGEVPSASLRLLASRD